MVNKQYTVQNPHPARSFTSESKRYSKASTSNHHLLSNNLDLTNADSCPRNYMRDPNVRPYSSSQNSDNVSEQAISMAGDIEGDNKQDNRLMDKEADINKIGRFQYIVQMDHEMVREAVVFFSLSIAK